MIFNISAADKSTLDELEGRGKGYEEKLVNIRQENGEMILATTYFATKIDTSLKPYTWYKKHVIEGAKEANLPSSYIKNIESVEADEDPDKKREAKEIQIYQ